MTTKEMARQVLQKLHDAYNQIPNEDLEDFDRTQYEKFSKAMDDAVYCFKSSGANSVEALRKQEAMEWAKSLPDKD